MLHEKPCIYKHTCGFDICMMSECPYYEPKTKGKTWAERRMIMGKCDTCGKKKYGYLCDGCIHDPDATDKYEPMTNADRIRAMSDEELAKHLHDIGWDCHLCAEHRRLDNEPLLRGEKCDEKCVEHCLEWLKQPVKEGGSGK